MEINIEIIVKKVKPIYLDSVFYTHTIWSHVLRVSELAKGFAKKMGHDWFIAEAGGLLHDLGAAKYGQKDHHITGAQEATAVLLECECPLALIGPIVSSVYSNRGSQKIVFQTPEAKYVAAADALDHFANIEELWKVQVEDLGILEIEVYRTLSEKLKRDWEKIDPEIKVFLDRTYEQAQEELLKIVSKKRKSGKKP